LLFRESAAAALRLAPDARSRTELLQRIASVQEQVGDYAGALQTAAALGEWRLDVRRSLTCRLLEDRRVDEAYRAAARSENRDWALAHLASQLTNPPHSLRSQRVDQVDTAALVKRAFVVARDVRTPRAKADAYASMTYNLWRRGDTSNAVSAAHAALTALERVRDPDIVATRTALVSGILGRVGKLDEALPLLRSLPAHDRLTPFWFFIDSPAEKDSRVIAELRALADLVPSNVSPNAKAGFASDVARALRQFGDSARASALEARYPLLDVATGQSWTKADNRSPADDADSLATAGLWSAALAAIERIPDPMRVGFRARAYLALGDREYGQSRDSVRHALRRASTAARATSLGDTLRDRLLTDIAAAQLSRGFHEDGLETLALVRDGKSASYALGEAGGVPNNNFTIRDRYSLLRRAPQAEARILAVSGLIWNASTKGNPSRDDMRWLTALTDSLPLGSPRRRAQIAIALNALAQKDTVSARRRLLNVLETSKPALESPAFAAVDPSEDLVPILVRIGATDEALSWARSFTDPYARAAALLRVGEGLLERAKIGEPQWITNGPDSCRAGF
jgi:hypothetical protein